MFVCCECCVLSGRGLCDELITRPEESHRLWCVVVCDLEETNLVNEEGQGQLGGYRAKRKKIEILSFLYSSFSALIKINIFQQSTKSKICFYYFCIKITNTNIFQSLEDHHQGLLIYIEHVYVKVYNRRKYLCLDKNSFLV